ncbi:MAG: VWA domain-containing protein [Ruminococcus sp.]|nr:VWA domain-containing protein [Ruminococcus sp.]
MSISKKSQSFFADPLNAAGIAKKSLVMFFLIDTSGSMKGTKMGELNTAMEELIPEIRRVGAADTDVKAAVLTFSSDVSWITPQPVPIESFEWSRLRADGETNMGEAFRELNSKLSRSAFMNAPSLSYAPVIFLMTDGYPSDEYREYLEQLSENTWFRYAIKTALAIGSDTNDRMLERFTGDKDTIVHTSTGDELVKIIKTIAVTSAQIGSRSMTLSAYSGEETTENDVYSAKQKQLGQQLQ